MTENSKPRSLARVRRILARRYERNIRCAPKCRGWDVFDSDSYGLEIEACGECNAYAKERHRPQLTDDDVALIPEARDELAREYTRAARAELEIELQYIRATGASPSNAALVRERMQQYRREREFTERFQVKAEDLDDLGLHSDVGQLADGVYAVKSALVSLYYLTVQMPRELRARILGSIEEEFDPGKDEIGIAWKR